MGWRHIDAGFVSMIVLAFVLAMVLDPAGLTPPSVSHHIPTPAIGRYCVGVKGDYKGWSTWAPVGTKLYESPDESCADMPNPMHGDNNVR